MNEELTFVEDHCKYLYNDQPTVMCHLDLLAGNIIYDNQKGALCLENCYVLDAFDH
jgi:thiamine kinase-like enzyme